jgi:thiol:disulfide interchange protein DsbC
MNVLTRITLLVSIFALPGAFAAESADIQALRKALAERLPQAADATIKQSPVNGLYEVLAGSQVMYMTGDARYVIDGNLFDLTDRRNLTEETRSSIRKEELTELGEQNMLVYKPKGEVKHTITVFTDIFCPYCQRLHQEMDEYLAKGVKVRYVFVPFKGKKSFDTSVSVWCADDRNAAMDKAKGGEEIAMKTCDNPIKQHQTLASTLGIRGTPAIMLENGYLNPGYVPAEKLVQQMESMGL